MTAKRFTVDEGLENVLCWEINDKENEDMTCGECAKLLNELAEENEQLKQAYTQLKHRHSLLHDVCIDAECDRDSYRKDIVSLEEENEQLKEQNADWETAFDNCKHYKEAYGTEIVKIKQTIKDMMENERTELGRSVLKQLWEAIR